MVPLTGCEAPRIPDGLGMIKEKRAARCAPDSAHRTLFPGCHPGGSGCLASGPEAPVLTRSLTFSFVARPLGRPLCVDVGSLNLMPAKDSAAIARARGPQGPDAHGRTQLPMDPVPVVSTQSENVPSFCKMRMSPFALRRRGAGLHPAAAWQRLLAALEWLERFVTIKS